MFRVLTIFTILSIILITNGNIITNNIAEDNSLEHNIKLIENIEDLKLINSNNSSNPLLIEANPTVGFRYVLGRRISGDRLVGHGSNSYKYPTYKDIDLTLTYPTSGIGATVTYVEILVQQSSSIGNAYVTHGGIGQRFIQIIVSAKATNYFTYSASIYGI